jgi:energy-coupling factor transporter ATP-binding protein EcfA2
MTIDVFRALEQNNIQYVIWKDTHKILVFFEGNSELDLLVNEKDKNQFERIISEHGFSKLKILERLRKEGIAHYIKFDGNAYYHLHVYYQFRTGNHYVKEYHFNDVNGIFENNIYQNGIKVVSANDEFLLLLIRLIIKRSALFASLKNSELNRARKLFELVDKAVVLKKLSKLIANDNLDLDFLYKVAIGQEKSRSKLNAARHQFNNYRTVKGSQFYLQLIRTKLYLLKLRFNKQSNKVLKNKGVTVAIMGTDGSGKSSIVAALLKIFKKKTSCKTLYLGGNNKTYSLETRFYYFLYYGFRIFSLFKEKYYIAWYLYYYSICLLEYGKAKDRVNKIKKGNRLRNKGWVVIFERFPIVGLFDSPRTLFDLNFEKWEAFSLTKIIKKRIQKNKSLIENVEEADLMFLVTTDFEIMAKRRALMDNEVKDINRKLNTQKMFLSQSDKEIIEISNNGEFAEVISSVNNRINQELCKYN